MNDFTKEELLILKSALHSAWINGVVTNTASIELVNKYKIMRDKVELMYEKEIENEKGYLEKMLLTAINCY